MSLLDDLKSSGNKLLLAEATDMSKWEKLRHNKSDLETFLNFNIAEIKFKTKDGNESQIVCTSNTTLVKLFSVEKENEKKKSC